VTQSSYHPREDWVEWTPTRHGADASLDLEAPRDLPDGSCEVVSASVDGGRVRVVLRVLGARSSKEDPAFAGNAGSPRTGPTSPT
jgi:hypothetical protein